MDKDSEIIRRFECYGKQMVTVLVNHNAHVMPIEEWKRAYRSLYPKIRKTIEEI